MPEQPDAIGPRWSYELKGIQFPLKSAGEKEDLPMRESWSHSIANVGFVDELEVSQ
jgi:hypothetical protein